MSERTHPRRWAVAALLVLATVAGSLSVAQPVGAVSPEVPTVTLALTPSSSPQITDELVLRATVSGGRGVPTGLVTFFIAGNGRPATSLGGVPLRDGTIGIQLGGASLARVFGLDWTLTAAYFGDANYLPTESEPLVVSLGRTPPAPSPSANCPARRPYRVYNATRSKAIAAALVARCDYRTEWRRVFRTKGAFAVPNEWPKSKVVPLRWWF